MPDLRYQARKHRKAVGDSQNWRCVYCHKDVSGKGKAHLDHIMPISQGGTNDRDNLQILCRRCNIRKSGHTPSPALDAYMIRRSQGDRAIDLLKPILIETYELKGFTFKSDKDMFAFINWGSLWNAVMAVYSDDIDNPQREGRTIDVARAAMAGDIEKTRRLVEENARELQRYRFRHSPTTHIRKYQSNSRETMEPVISFWFRPTKVMPAHVLFQDTNPIPQFAGSLFAEESGHRPHHAGRDLQGLQLLAGNTNPQARRRSSRPRSSFLGRTSTSGIDRDSNPPIPSTLIQTTCRGPPIKMNMIEYYGHIVTAAHILGHDVFLSLT